MPETRVRWLATSGVGYGQPGFIAKCSTCEKSFSRVQMGVRRFCEEVGYHQRGERVYFRYCFVKPVSSANTYFRETALDPATGVSHELESQKFGERIIEVYIILF